MRKRRCDFCGEPIDKNEKFCKSCGNEIINDDKVEDAIIEDPNNSEQNNTFIISIVIILVVMIIGFGIYYLLK